MLTDDLARLRTGAAVRERANRIFALAETGGLTHFSVDLSRLDIVARYVIDTMRLRYPGSAIPSHSRWRHFDAGGIARGAVLGRRLSGLPTREIARRRVELATVSVLLDAGAGDAWRYHERASGRSFARSEGLAVASFDLFCAGAFSADTKDALRVDAEALVRIGVEALTQALQVSDDNPLPGVEGRAMLLRRLGMALSERPDLFGTDARIGNLVDTLARRQVGSALPAGAILDVVLDGFSGIWPGGYRHGDVALGDVWPHWAARRDAGDPTDGLVPFHKLSQWLCYSLIEPLEDAGIAVNDVAALTGLPEYRNGGLFIDLGVLVPRRADLLAVRHAVGSETVVEWRALTVVLLDRLAERVRAISGLDTLTMPELLEGGSWEAGRRIAAERRPGGSPPLLIESDGTVF